MAKDFKYVVVDGRIAVTDGTATEVLAEFLTNKSRTASSEEEKAMTSRQAGAVDKMQNAQQSQSEEMAQ